MTYIPPSVTVSSIVNTAESTASTAYTDLTTVGPSATVTVGPSGNVTIWFGAITQRLSTNNTAWISVAASGANTIAASDTNAIQCANINWGAGSGFPSSVTGYRVLTLTGLTPGSTTFKLQYRIDGGSAFTFLTRSIVVTAQ